MTTAPGSWGAGARGRQLARASAASSDRSCSHGVTPSALGLAVALSWAKAQSRSLEAHAWATFVCDKVSANTSEVLEGAPRLLFL